MRFRLRVRVTCVHSVAHYGRQALEEGDFAGVECPLSERLKQLVLQLGAKYVLGPGVEARGTATYAQSEDALGQGQDYTGFGVVGGLVLKF